MPSGAPAPERLLEPGGRQSLVTPIDWKQDALLNGSNMFTMSLAILWCRLLIGNFNVGRYLANSLAVAIVLWRLLTGKGGNRKNSTHSPETRRHSLVEPID